METTNSSTSQTIQDVSDLYYKKEYDLGFNQYYRERIEDLKEKDDLTIGDCLWLEHSYLKKKGIVLVRNSKQNIEIKNFMNGTSLALFEFSEEDLNDSYIKIVKIMPRSFMSPGSASKRYGSFRILQDGSLVYYDKIDFDNLLRCIEERQDPAEIINYFSGLGFNFDFEDVLDEGSVLINITYKNQGVAEFEVTGDFWGVLKFTYDWYINNGTETETERISGYCQPIQNFGRQDEKDRRR